MNDLASRVLAVPREYQALGNERFQADGATFIRNRAAPESRNANHVTQVIASTSEEIDRLLVRVEQEFEDIPHRSFELDFTVASSVEARLVLDGYRWSEGLLLLVEGDLIGNPKPCDVRPVDDNAGWDAVHRMWDADRREEETRGRGAYSKEGARARMGVKRAKSPPVRCWLACVDGDPVAYCSSWSGVGGIGLVEDLLTHPDFRHQGLATALVHHCVGDCREQGAGPVLICAGANETPKQMYAAMGFKPVAVSREYWKEVKL